MIDIKEKDLCSGCGACSQICPKHCITMASDGEGFLYPFVDHSTCVDCHLCENVCHELCPFEDRLPLETYAAINTDEDVRMDSSSGGVFTLLAEQTVKVGGVVFGAAFDKNWEVEITYAEDKERIAAFRGSKYVQARIGSSYLDAKHFLEEGRQVLFSGTPCQIAGLHHFLRKKYDNLTTVDVVCHGAPSPMVWKKYLSEVTNNVIKAIKDCRFRNKDNGWKRFNFKMKYSEGDEQLTISAYHRDNHFMRAFLSDMILRPSCYSCKAKSGSSHSDITIADFWGIENLLPSMYDDKGTGLVLANSSKGIKLLEDIHIYKIKVPFNDAVIDNPSWFKSVTPHIHREHFFKKVLTSKSITKLIDKELKPHKTLRQRINSTIIDFKVIVWKIIHGGGPNQKDYMDYISIPNNNCTLTSISEIHFRDKRNGWSKYYTSINYGIVE